MFSFDAIDPPPRYLVVLEQRIEKSDYGRAAEKLAMAHDGDLVAWDGDWNTLVELLKVKRPAWLALVLDPGTIDANLPRRLIPILARLDADPFVDCSFGLITGATGADALRFVERDLALAGHDLPARKLAATSVVVDKCLRIPERVERGPEGRELATTSLWVTGKDAGWKEFLAQGRGAQQGCGLVEWGHCGDPQGIWLFSMYRNLDKDKHWAWDPKKVGQDPAGEMPRMTPATLLEGVDLGGAIVINGSCHSAVTRRAIVGLDIVSTFGDTGGNVRFFDIAAADSFPLQAIAHGAGGYIGPLAANNANRAAIEEWWLRSGGVALGEVTRRCYDELMMGAAEPLSPELFHDGKPDPEESPMYHSSFHRVLFGDPALVPWKAPVKSDHVVEQEAIEGGLRLKIRWNAPGRDPWIWDPWREAATPQELGRIYERIELAGEVRGKPEVKLVSAFTLLGKLEAPLALEAQAKLECDPWGKYVLHLVLRGPRARMTPLDRKDMPDAIGADVEVRFAR